VYDCRHQFFVIAYVIVVFLLACILLIVHFTVAKNMIELGS